MFEHAYEYRGVWKALLGSKAGAVVRNNIQKMLCGLIRDEYRKELQKRKKAESGIPVELFVHFLASTFMSVMSWWLSRKNPSSPKDIDAMFRALVLPGLESIFE